MAPRKPAPAPQAPLPWEPTEQMVEAGMQALALSPPVKGRRYPDNFDAAELSELRHKVVQVLRAAAEAARPMGQLAAYEPPTCGTDYLVAERALRVVERASPLEPLSGDAITAIAELSDRAGIAFARQSLRATLYDDVPGW